MPDKKMPAAINFTFSLTKWFSLVLLTRLRIITDTIKAIIDTITRYPVVSIGKYSEMFRKSILCSFYFFFLQ